MRSLVALALLMAAPWAWCWQLALGVGLAMGHVTDTQGATGRAQGWIATAMVDRQIIVGERFVLQAAFQQLATQPVKTGVVAGARLIPVTIGWQWRWPISYRLRPWLGIGAGFMTIDVYDRVGTNGGGYAVARYPPRHTGGAVWTMTTVVPVDRRTDVAATLLWRPGGTFWMTDIGVLWVPF